MACYLCNETSTKLKYNQVRDREDIEVLECTNCGLVYLSSMNHISDQFYEESGMMNGKIELDSYRKNSLKDDQRRFDFLKEDLIGKSVLDFGCGAGGFLHLARNVTKDARGIELDKSINETLNNEGIRCFNHIDQIEGKYDYITLFHVLEHIQNPIAILNSLKLFLNPNGKIIIEVPSADDALITLYDSDAFKRFTYWSCHLYLYNSSTLKSICERAGLNVNYVKQIQRYGLANHLHWLAKSKPAGHKVWQFMNTPMLDAQYEQILGSIGKCDTIICECVIEK